MKKTSRFLAALCIAGTVAASSTAAQAHAIWFAQRATQLALIYGIGADDLDSAKRLPLINNVAGYDADYKPVKTSLKLSGPLVLVDSEEPVTVTTAVMDYGLWSRTPDGEWHKAGKDEFPTATVSEHNFKYAVHISGQLTKPLPLFPDQLLQIVPVDPTLPQQMGKPLRLRVLYRGKPVAGATVMHDYVNDPDEVAPKTGPDGTITITVRNQGPNVVTAIYVTPSDNPAKYNSMEYRSTLSFALPHAPE